MTRINAKDLKLALKDMRKRYRPLKSNHESLNNVWIVPHEQGTAIVASSLDTEYTVVLQSEGELPHAFVVSMKTLGKIAKAAKSDVTIALCEDEAVFCVDDGACFRVGTKDQHADTIRTAKVNEERLMVTQTLHTALQKSTGFAGDSDRPSLANVCLDIHDGVLKVVSTDGHRIIVTRVDDVDVQVFERVFEGKTALIPAEALSFVTQVFDGDVYLSRDEDGHVHVGQRDKWMRIDVVQWNYPQWRHVLPDGQDGEKASGVVASDTLLSQVKLVLQVLGAYNNKVTCTMESDESSMHLSAKDDDIDFDNTVALGQARGRGSFMINCAYVSDALDALSAEDVRVTYYGKHKPVMFVDPEHTETEVLIMPFAK